MPDRSNRGHSRPAANGTADRGTGDRALRRAHHIPPSRLTARIGIAFRATERAVSDIMETFCNVA